MSNPLPPAPPPLPSPSPHPTPPDSLSSPHPGQDTWAGKVAHWTACRGRRRGLHQASSPPAAASAPADMAE
eukprot:753461-Hanusia_phi.AAC.9